jgi:type III restriction enzyme
MTGATPSGFEVDTPILNSPYEEPAEHWLLKFGERPQRIKGRRKAGYWFRSPDAGDADEHVTGVWTELSVVNTIRERMREWRNAGRPGITRTTRELIEWWLAGRATSRRRAVRKATH